MANTSWTRADATPNPYLYNAGSELNEKTAWYETALRSYDPYLGRFNGVDPMADKYAGTTPFNYAFNSPAVLNDPTGAEPRQLIRTDDTPWEAPAYTRGKYQYYDNFSQWGAANQSYGGWGQSNPWAWTGMGGGGIYGGGIGMFGVGVSFGPPNPYRDAAAVQSGQMSLASYTDKYGYSVNIFSSSSNLSETGSWLNVGAPNTAWFFNGQLIDITRARTGTLVWGSGSIDGQTKVIGGGSPLAESRISGGDFWSGTLLTIGGITGSVGGAKAFGAERVFGGVLNNFKALQAESNTYQLGLHYGKEGAKAANVLKWSQRIGTGFTWLGAGLAVTQFAVSDQSAGDYTRLGMNALIFGLTVVPEPTTTGIGIGLGLLEAGGVFNSLYNYADQVQQTGVMVVPMPVGVVGVLKIR